jgi:hypothetical protein
VDITFADPKDVPEVNATNCFNSSDIGFNDVYSSPITGTSAASPSLSPQWTMMLALLAGLLFTIS